MAIFPNYTLPKYKSPVRITKPYMKPNRFADAIIGGIGAYTNMQGMNLKKQMFMAQMAQQQRKIQEAKDLQDAKIAALDRHAMSLGTTGPREVEGPQGGVMAIGGTEQTSHPGWSAVADFYKAGFPLGSATSLAQPFFPKNQSSIDPSRYATQMNTIDNRAHTSGERLVKQLMPVFESEVLNQDYIPDTRGAFKKFFLDEADTDVEAEEVFTSGLRNELGDIAMHIAKKYKMDSNAMIHIRKKLASIIAKYKESGPLKKDDLQSILTEFDDSIASGDLSVNPTPAQILEHLRRKQAKK